MIEYLKYFRNQFNFLQFQTILSNPKHIKKSFFYDNIKPWLGTSILTSEGNNTNKNACFITKFRFDYQVFIILIIK